MPTHISPEQQVFTLINVFTVTPENQQQLAETLAETTETIARHLPGFISASIHKSSDGTRVVNYGQWVDQASFRALIQRQDMQDRMKEAIQLGQPDGHFYTVEATITADEGMEARPPEP